MVEIFTDTDFQFAAAVVSIVAMILVAITVWVYIAHVQHTQRIKALAESGNGAEVCEIYSIDERCE